MGLEETLAACPPLLDACVGGGDCSHEHTKSSEHAVQAFGCM